MTEETAIRIAEALESIDGILRVGLVFMLGISICFWLIAMFKN